MLDKAVAFFLYVLGLLNQVLVPCSDPELLLPNAIDHQQYLGKWFFQAAGSFRESDVQKFRVIDNMKIVLEEPKNHTLLLTGHMRIGDDCVKQTWTYYIRPDRDDVELEGRPQRRTLLWSGNWVDCPDCIIFQEIEPPLKETDSQDSLGRFLLYSRRSEVQSEVVTAFEKKLDCHNNMLVNVRLPQEKEFCS